MQSPNGAPLLNKVEELVGHLTVAAACSVVARLLNPRPVLDRCKKTLGAGLLAGSVQVVLFG